jgi:hypothetical protein
MYTLFQSMFLLAEVDGYACIRCSACALHQKKGGKSYNYSKNGRCRAKKRRDALVTGGYVRIEKCVNALKEHSRIRILITKSYLRRRIPATPARAQRDATTVNPKAPPTGRSKSPTVICIVSVSSARYFAFFPSTEIPATTL